MSPAFEDVGDIVSRLTQFTVGSSAKNPTVERKGFKMTYKVVVEDTSEHYLHTVAAELNEEQADDVARRLNVLFSSLFLQMVAFAREEN